MMRGMANRWTALALVFVTRISMGVQFQAVAAVAPLLVNDLSLSYARFGMLLGLYLLPGVAFALPGGVIGRRLGERRVIVASLALMVVGGALTAQAHGFYTAMAGRLLAGIGAVVMNILLPKLLADWFVGREMSTAMAVMLTSWPVGLGLANATLGGVAASSSWRVAMLATSALALVGLVAMLIFREAPRSEAPAGGALDRRALRLALSSGFAWGCFNASVVVIIAFGPGLLIAHGASLQSANFLVTLAIWITMVSVPLGGLLSDRLHRPTLLIAAGSLVAAGVIVLLPVAANVRVLPFLQPGAFAFCVIGLAIGPPPGPVMALLPRALPPERVTAAFGVYYTVFYAMMAVTQPAAGLVRDLAGDPAAPIVFAALVMAATALGLAIFRRLERAA
jgi:MFS family permease